MQADPPPRVVPLAAVAGRFGEAGAFGACRPKKSCPTWPRTRRCGWRCSPWASTPWSGPCAATPTTHGTGTSSGVSVFALLMGLGGGFIRDMLLGNLPAASLRDPWSLATVLVAIGDRPRHRPPPGQGRTGDVVPRRPGPRPVRRDGHRVRPGLRPALRVGDPARRHHRRRAAGCWCRCCRGRRRRSSSPGTPTALLAVTGSLTYAVVSVWSPSIASVAGIAVVVAGQYAARRLGIRTRPTGVRPAQ